MKESGKLMNEWVQVVFCYDTARKCSKLTNEFVEVIFCYDTCHECHNKIRLAQNLFIQKMFKM